MAYNSYSFGHVKQYFFSLWSLLSSLPIDWQTCSSSKTGIFFIGEKPNFLMNRVTVVEANISSYTSFPPTVAIGYWKTDHRGLELWVAVNKGQPLQSLMGPFLLICHIDKVIN